MPSAPPLLWGLRVPNNGESGRRLPQGAQPAPSLSCLRRRGHDGAGSRHPESHGWLSPSCDLQGWTGLPDTSEQLPQRRASLRSPEACLHVCPVIPQRHRQDRPGAGRALRTEVASWVHRGAAAGLLGGLVGCRPRATGQTGRSLPCVSRAAPAILFVR